MTAVPFDTHKFVQTLREAGVEEKQAIAHKDALTGAAFATGADIRVLENKFETKIQALEVKIDALGSKIDSTRWILLILTIAVIAPQLKGLF